MTERRRIQKSDTLEACLADEAKRLREEAESLPPGIAREQPLRKARQAETGSHMSEWLTSLEYSSRSDSPQMQDYRAFLIGRDGHVLDRHEFWCVDDDAAKEQAKRLVDGHDVELWHRDHRIAVFKHETN